MRLKAHAKVNLGLSVLGKRSDGYHDVDTLIARLELHDTVEFEARRRGVALSVKGEGVPLGRDNLAVAAAEAYLKAAGVSHGVHIHLEKRIPVAAGLGGGSSDAAAVLRGLSRLYPGDVDLLELAAAIGSDVPFFVADVVAARARGRGEQLEVVELPPLDIVLVNPGCRVRTQEAYQALVGFTPPLNVDSLIESLTGSGEAQYYNALEPGMTSLQPLIDGPLAALRSAGVRGVCLSGSGATCFALARDSVHARSVADALAAAHPAWWTCPTRVG